MKMRLTEQELRHIIREAILAEGFFDFLFSDEEDSKKRQKAKARLEKYKKLKKQDPNWDLSAYSKKEMEKRIKDSDWGKLQQMEDENEELLDDLFQSMSKEDKMKHLRKKARKNMESRRTGEYYREFADSLR